MRNKMKRRALIKGVATAALFAPVARFWTDIAEAQSVASAKRLICIALSNGMGDGGRFVAAAAGQPGGVEASGVGSRKSRVAIRGPLHGRTDAVANHLGAILLGDLFR